MLKWTSTVERGAFGPTYTSSTIMSRFSDVNTWNAPFVGTATIRSTTFVSGSRFEDNTNTYIEYFRSSSDELYGVGSTSGWSMTKHDVSGKTGYTASDLEPNGARSYNSINSDTNGSYYIQVPFYSTGSFNVDSGGIFYSSTTTESDWIDTYSTFEAESYYTFATTQIETIWSGTSSKEVLTTGYADSVTTFSSVILAGHSSVEKLALTGISSPVPFDVVIVEDCDSWERFVVAVTGFNGVRAGTVFTTATRITRLAESRAEIANGETTSGTFTTGAYLPSAAATTYTLTLIDWGADKETYEILKNLDGEAFPRTATRVAGLYYTATKGRESEYGEYRASGETNSSIAGTGTSYGMVEVPVTTSYPLQIFTSIYSNTYRTHSSVFAVVSYSFSVSGMNGGTQGPGFIESFSRKQTRTVPPTEMFPVWALTGGRFENQSSFEAGRKYHKSLFVPSPSATQVFTNLDGPSFSVFQDNLSLAALPNVMAVVKYPKPVTGVFGLSDLSSWTWAFSSDSTFATSARTSSSGTSVVTDSSTYSQAAANGIGPESASLIFANDYELDSASITRLTKGVSLFCGAGTYGFTTFQNGSSSSANSTFSSGASFVGPDSGMVAVTCDYAVLGFGDVSTARQRIVYDCTSFSYEY